LTHDDGLLDSTYVNETIINLLKESDPNWQAVVDAAIVEFAGCTGTLHRLDPADNLLKLVAQRGVPEFVLSKITTIPVGKGIAGVAAERREPVELCNLQADLGGIAKPDARKTNVQGSLAVPCLHNSELRGTLGIGLMTAHDFTDEEKFRALEIGRAIAARL
jgi:putative methionine-R-sulfoxide reductase with GAF domain